MIDARSSKGFSARSPFNREPINKIKGNGRIDMSGTKKELIAMDGQQVRTLQPGQNAQFQGDVLEMDSSMLFELESPLLEAHLKTLKADQQAEFIDKYQPLPENMKRAALMQIAQMHQDVIQQAVAAINQDVVPVEPEGAEQEVQEPAYKNGGLTKSKAKEILHDGTVHGKKITDKQRRYFAAVAFAQNGGYQQVQAPTEGFDFKSITSNRPVKENTIDLSNAKSRVRVTGAKNKPTGLTKTVSTKSQLLGSISDQELKMNYDSGASEGIQDPSIQAEMQRRGLLYQPAEMQSQLFYDVPPVSATTEAIHTVTGRAIPPPMQLQRTVIDQRVAPVMAPGTMYNSNLSYPAPQQQLQMTPQPVFAPVPQSPAFSDKRMNWNYQAQHTDKEVQDLYTTDSPFRGGESSFTNRKK